MLSRIFHVRPLGFFVVHLGAHCVIQYLWLYLGVKSLALQHGYRVLYKIRWPHHTYAKLLYNLLQFVLNSSAQWVELAELHHRVQVVLSTISCRFTIRNNQLRWNQITLWLSLNILCEVFQQPQAYFRGRSILVPSPRAAERSSACFSMDECQA